MTDTLQAVAKYLETFALEIRQGKYESVDMEYRQPIVDVDTPELISAEPTSESYVSLRFQKVERPLFHKIGIVREKDE